MFKISITGPESTGKSTLTAALAEYFNSYAVPEYAREYVERLDRPYSFDDICRIACRQIEEQNFYSKINDKPFVFFDTDLIITKVWFEYCYGKLPVFFEKELQNKYFDLYLLCLPDLPWYPDSVREHGGEDRRFFFERYRCEIEKNGIPYFIISGTETERTQNAIEAVKAFAANCRR